MKALTKKSQKTFEKLTCGISEMGMGKKTENSEAFMPVNAHYLWETKAGKIYSVSHNYIQNGDLMNDPEVTFLASNVDGKVYPLSYRQDAIGINWEPAIIDENGSIRHDQKMQADITKFANQWMTNINYQQF